MLITAPSQQKTKRRMKWSQCTCKGFGASRLLEFLVLAGSLDGRTCWGSDLLIQKTWSLLKVPSLFRYERESGKKWWTSLGKQDWQVTHPGNLNITVSGSSKDKRNNLCKTCQVSKTSVQMISFKTWRLRALLWWTPLPWKGQKCEMSQVIIRVIGRMVTDSSTCEVLIL